MHGSHRRRGWSLAAVGASAVLFTVATIGPASAATQTQTIDQTLSGQGAPITFFDSGLQVCDECVPDVLVENYAEAGAGASISADLSTKWTSDAKTTVTYNDALLRQGATLDTSDTMATSNGSLTATFAVHYFLGLVVRDDDQGLPDWTQTTTSISDDVSLPITVPCELPATGGTRHCESDPKSFTLVSYEILPPDLVSLELQLRVRLSADVSGDGVVTVRHAEVVGGIPNGPDATLTFSPTSDTQADPLAILCTQPVGNDLSYGLTDTGISTSVDYGIPVSLWFGATIQDPIPDVGVEVGLGTIPLGGTTVTLTAADASADLGPIQKDNLPPTPVTAAAYSGSEGTPIQFDGSGSSDNCGFPTLRWDFSDGGVAFGAKPFHTFADNKVYSGLLTASDVAGNTATTTFSVTVANVNPVAQAGPDGSAAWGRDVAFNGFGTDPGAGDQSTLTYQWAFGDGSVSPTVTSASGGYAVSHAYSTPGVYTAVLTVTDKDGGTHSDARDVTIRKRTVSVASLGDTTGTYDTAGSLTGSITDEFGSAVSGRTLAFAVDGAAAGSSSTNGLGRASLGWTPLVNAGSHTTSATFAGDSLYEAGSGSNGVAVAVKGTSTAYTGAVTGGANKTIVMSAVLKDATGKPLAGRSIAFQLGTQTATATTDANGVASTSLKLNQKNGTYALTATWTPTGADTARYSGSSASAVFKLQAK